jgi:hypothetical protein
VTHFGTKCNQSNVFPQQLTIAANSTATVQVSVDLTKRSESQIGLPSRMFVTQLFPAVLNHIRNKPLEVRFRVASKITLNRLSLDFGDWNVSQLVPQSQSIIVTSHHVSVRDLISTSDSNSTQVETKKVTVHGLPS